MLIKISEDNKYVYWSDKPNEIHGEPLNKDNKDYWIELAATHTINGY